MNSQKGSIKKVQLKFRRNECKRKIRDMKEIREIAGLSRKSRQKLG